MAIKINYAGQQMSVAQGIEQAKELINKKQFVEAEALARTVLKRAPKSHVCKQILGIALAEQNDPGKKTEALEMCTAAVEAQPDNPNYVNVLANVLGQVGEFERAEKLYMRALALSPGLPDAKYNLAKLWTATGKFSEARDVFQEMLPVISDVLDVYQNLGACEYSLGNYKQAMLWFKLALGYDGDNYELHKNYALCLTQLHDYPAALHHFNVSLEHGNTDYTLLTNIAYCHNAIGEYSAAEEFVEAYLNSDQEILSGDELNSLTLLASIKKSLGKDQETNKIYQQIVDKFGDQAWAYSNYLFTRIFLDIEDQESLYEKHVDFSRRYEEPVKHLWGGYTNNPDPSRKLKIGYVSADFFSHSVSYFSLPLIANHDKNQFEVHCYSAREVEKDPVMARIRREVVWHDIQFKSFEQVADQIREDQIDLLVDLSGHTGGNQLLAFARKPAPIQFTWIGYPFSTGLKAIDYRIVDNYIEPEGVSEHISSEKLLRIDGCFCAYRPSVSRPHRLTSGELDVRPTPALKNGFITFGCCNNFNKVSTFTLEMWAKILQRVPGSKLLLEIANGTREDVRLGVEAKVLAAGIDLAQLIISDRKKNPQYMLYHDIDIVLDPYPCNGGTTTCDALFMSVPVVSLEGDRFMSRLGASFISNAGHPEWVTTLPEQYIEIACNLASDVQALDRVRQNLRHQVETSPMMDEIGFARKLERAYRKIWRDWCVSQVGESIDALPELEEHSGEVNQAYATYLEHVGQVRELVATEDWHRAVLLLQEIEAQPVHTIEHDYYAALVKIRQGKTISMASPIANQYMDEAVVLLRSVLERQADHADAWVALGDLQMYRNRYEEAEISMLRALKFVPDNVRALLNMALLLSARHDWERALARCQHAKQLNPELAWAYAVEAKIYLKQGDATAAVVSAERACQIEPDNIDYQELLLSCLMYTDSWPVQKIQQWVQSYGQKLRDAIKPSMPLLNTPLPNKKLKVGLISGHFYDNPWAYVWLPLCELISRTEVELFVYHHGESIDHLMHRVKRAVHAVRYTRGLSTETVAALLVDDQIDVLIALDAYGEYSTLPILAHRAAPVQMVWPQKDILLPDGVFNYMLVDQPGLDQATLGVTHLASDQHGAKQAPISLPLAYQPFMNNPEFHNMSIFQSQALPAEVNGYVTFGSQADGAHLTKDMLQQWATLLVRMPTARLKLRTLMPKEEVMNVFEPLGVDSERVQLVNNPRDSRYHFYLDVDIVLDTYPASNLLQTLEALWMGVPVLTLCGALPQSQASANLLKHIGVDRDWVVHDMSLYVDHISLAAHNSAALQDYRCQLRGKLEEAGLTDCVAFAKSFAASLRAAWMDWCASDAAKEAQQLHLQQELLSRAGEYMAQENYPMASATYLDVLKLADPLRGEAMYGLGLAHLMQGDGETAQALLVRAVSQLEQMAGSPVMLADCLVSLAHACHMIGRDVDAIAYFKHSLAYQDSEQVKSWLEQLGAGRDGVLLH